MPDITGILNHFRKNGMSNLDIIPVELSELQNKLTGEHYSKFGYLLAALPLINELASTRTGFWYLADGNHRALALLAKVRLDNFEYKPIKVILTYFERDKLANQGITI